MMLSFIPQNRIHFKTRKKRFSFPATRNPGFKTFPRIGNTALTRVPSHWLWLESSHSVKNVTRVDSSHHFDQRDSSRLELPNIVTRLESLTWITLSLIQTSESFQSPTRKHISLDFCTVFTFTFISFRRR